LNLGDVECKPDLVRAEGEWLQVDLPGRAVPVVRTPDGLRAVSKGKPGKHERIETYLPAKFGAHLETACQAMAELAEAHEPADLCRHACRLYGAITIARHASPDRPARREG
jgi:hypothetical protein